jgi:hypothetical protein
MPLQIRRGTAAERNALTSPLVVGELLYVTDQGKIYIGDGTAIGASDIAGNPGQGGKGLIITGFTTEEAQDATNSLFSNGTHTNITFTYNDGADSLSAAVDLSSYTGNITVNGTIDADFRGSVFADNSTLLVDAVNGTIPYAVLSGVPTLVSQFTNDAGYLTAAALSGSNSFVADIKGSVFGDDSSVIINAVDNILNIPTITSSGSLVIRPAGLTSIQSSLIVGSATNNINGDLHIVRNAHSNSFDSSLYITNSHDTDIIDPFYFRRTRGTPTLYSAVQTNDQLGRISFLGWDGSQFLESASLRSTVIAVSSGIVESQLLITTQNSAGTYDTPYRLSNTGRLQLGNQTDSSQGSIDIVSQVRIGPSNDPGQPIVIRQFFNDQLSNSFGVQRARGTTTVPLPVQDDDGLFQIQITGYDGATYPRTAAINFLVDGPVSSGIVPGLMQFRTAGLDGQILVRATIDSSGTLNAMYGITGDLVGSVFADNSSRIIDATEGGKITAPSVSISDFLQLPVFADDSARSAAIPTPAQGMVIFMQSGSAPAATNQIQFFNGTNWISL